MSEGTKEIRMKKIIFLITLAFLAGAAHAKIETVLGDVPLKENTNLVGLPSAPSDEVIISRRQYVISYNKERRSPNWVAWKVDSRSLGSVDRSDKFEQDKELQEYLSQDPQALPAVTPDEYKGSCFDRGHQAPSADRTSSVASNEATFAMSNMLPQTPYLNRGLWQQLEQHTRDLVTQGNTVYVVAGPVYDKDFGEIGPNQDIPVPSKLFKVIIVKDGDKFRTISVVMPNVLRTGEEPTNKESLCVDSAATPEGQNPEWQRYRSNLKEIQDVTGLTLTR
jgi:endonuclease G